MARCLITGQSGFLGRHLSAHLSRTNKVLGLPRQFLYQPEFLKPFMEDVKPDYIFHLAAYGNKYDQQDEEQIVKANIVALFNLLAASRDIPYQAFINFSTSSTLLKYETFYSATKGAGERIVKAFVQKYDKPVVTVRPYSVYGPGDDSRHFIPTAINSFKEDLEIEVSPGDHDWIYADDLVEGVIKIAENADKLKGQCVNIGTGVAQSNYAIISILRDIFQKPGKVKRIKEKTRPYDCENWAADNNLLKSLGWAPKISLEEGLTRLVYEK